MKNENLQGFDYYFGTPSHNGTTRTIEGSRFRAQLVQNGEMIDLTTTFDAPMSRAEDINAIGQIVAGSILLEPDGTIIELGSLGGGGTSAEAINDHGQVVGDSRRA